MPDFLPLLRAIEKDLPSNITADVATTRMDGRHLFWHCFVEREIFIMDGNRL
jgi:hypothetical protein